LRQRDISVMVPGEAARMADNPHFTKKGYVAALTQVGYARRQSLTEAAILPLDFSAPSSKAMLL
jgi:hypothetical protein